MIACAAWVGFLAFGNVHDRETEIGILRSLGVGSMKIVAIFLMCAPRAMLTLRIGCEMVSCQLTDVIRREGNHAD
jgi:hypothetical protein